MVSNPSAVQRGLQCNISSARTGSSCGVFFPFDVILEVISSFPSPGPRLPAPSPSPSKVLAAWRIVWTCIDPMWDYSWVIGELDWATSHQGRLTTRCLLGCHFSAGSHCWLCGCPHCAGHCLLLNNTFLCLRRLSYIQTDLICRGNILLNEIRQERCLTTFLHGLKYLSNLWKIYRSLFYNLEIWPAGFFMYVYEFYGYDTKISTVTLFLFQRGPISHCS